jgi:hypothetical protein
VGFFADEHAPTAEELRRWAYAEGDSPYQDFDIVIAHDEELADTFVDLAADETCPARDFMLNVLYILAGDAVRTEYTAYPRARLEYLVACAQCIGDASLATWAARSRALMAAPHTFDYDLWCGGGFAYERPA